MDMAQHIHKQDNFFLFFFVYVCLGVYYVLYILATPFILLWNLFSTGLYNSINTNVNTNDLRGAYMGNTEAEAQAAKVEATQFESLGTQVVTKEVKVNKSLLDSRQQLINSIDANNEIRNDRPVTYRYVALDPSGKQVTNIFVAYSRVEVYTFLENEGYKVFKIETSPWIERLYGENAFANHKITEIQIMLFGMSEEQNYLI